MDFRHVSRIPDALRVGIKKLTFGNWLTLGRMLERGHGKDNAQTVGHFFCPMMNWLELSNPNLIRSQSKRMKVTDKGMFLK